MAHSFVLETQLLVVARIALSDRIAIQLIAGGTMSLYGTASTARDAAMELVKAGISSDAIKLAGTGTSTTAKKNGEADALYLSTLLVNLTKQISKK